MRRTTIALALASFLTSVPAAEDAASTELAGAVSRLAAAMEHLSAALEKQAAAGADAQARDRVQMAVGILQLRTRRADRLEDEIRQFGNEEEDIKSQAGQLQRVLEELNARLRQAGPDNSPAERQQQDDLARSLSLLEARARVIEDRKAALQGELDAELRKLSRLEAILDDWLKQQE
jgi:uncharacterized protein YukE